MKISTPNWVKYRILNHALARTMLSQIKLYFTRFLITTDGNCVYHIKTESNFTSRHLVYNVTLNHPMPLLKRISFSMKITKLRIKSGQNAISAIKILIELFSVPR